MIDSHRQNDMNKNDGKAIGKYLCWYSKDRERLVWLGGGYKILTSISWI